MTRSDWQEVKQLAEQLLELPPPARDAAARQACIADPALLSRVLAILDSYSDTDGFAGLTTATIPAPTRTLQSLDQASAVTTSVALQAHSDLIHFQLAAADLPAARRTLATVSTLQSTLRKADPNDLLINESDARMLLLEAAVLRAANSLPQASTVLARALTLTLRPTQPTPALQELSCLALHALSEIAARQNQPAESLAYLRQATPIARALRLAAPERAALLWASHVARFPQNTPEAAALRAEPAPPPVSPYSVPRGGLWITPPKTSSAPSTAPTVAGSPAK
jgi:hypothetical protein